MKQLVRGKAGKGVRSLFCMFMLLKIIFQKWIVSFYDNFHEDNSIKKVVPLPLPSDSAQILPL